MTYLVQLIYEEINFSFNVSFTAYKNWKKQINKKASFTDFFYSSLFLNCERMGEFWSSGEYASLKPFMQNADNQNPDAVIKCGETKFFGRNKINIITEEVNKQT